MAEVLVAFADAVRDAVSEYEAHAVGRLADDGMWEGWIEFIPLDGSQDVLVTPVESRQPEKEYLTYWATGLTPVFLEGALRRAKRPVTVRVKTVELPYSHAPANAMTTMTRVMPPGPEPVLDPLDIGSRNIDQLRQELGALNRPRLLNIIQAYDLNPTLTDISWMSDGQLAHFIVVAVEAQLTKR
jgi:hypothetical protein